MEKNYRIKVARKVLTVRIGQMLINEKYKNGDFKIPIHLALGHEAIAVSIDLIMKEKDLLVLTHRNIHYNLAREGSLKPEIDEYLLKDEGLAKGQLGSMNLANEERGIVYTSSILGNNLAVAAGLALGKKVKRDEGIVIVVTGDGAIEEGSFYESLVFLKSNDIPALIIIENNEWSLATKIDERRCPIDMKKFSYSLNIKYTKLSSNNTYKYIKKLKKIRDYALLEKTPVCVEVELKLLGSWVLKTDEYPHGKFINYHAGPAPTINLEDGAIIEKSEKDPVFIIKKYLKDSQFEKISEEILEFLKADLK